MAIRKEEEKKVGMKITDNMDGEKRAEEKLDMRKVDVFNLRDYLKYKEAVKNDNVKDVFPDTPIKELDMFRELLEKEQERS